MTASIPVMGAAHLMQLLTANRYEKCRNNMTSVSSRVLWDKPFVLPLPSQTMYMQISFPEINICMKAKDINEFLGNEFQAKCCRFYFFCTVVPQLCACTLRSINFWKSMCKKEFFFPSIPLSLISLWFMSEDVRFKPQIEEHDVFSLLPLFQWLEVETGPKRDSGDWIQLWHKTVLLPCSIPDDPLAPVLHCGDNEGTSLLFSCLSET